MTFKEAVQFLNDNDVKAYELGKESGKSISSLDKILKGETKNPHNDTKDFIIGYAEKLIRKGQKGVLDTLEGNEEVYLDQLAVAVRKHKDKLMQRTIFKDLVYIEALKMIVQVKEGDTINMKKLEKMNE